MKQMTRALVAIIVMGYFNESEAGEERNEKGRDEI